MLAQTTGYAIQALGFLATQSTPVLIRNVAKATGIPQSYLAKIMHLLARKGIVRTKRGTHGGVHLAPGTEKLGFYEVAVLMDDPVVTMRCMLGTEPCSPNRNCPCHEFWSKQRERELAMLKRKSIAHMARFLKRRSK